MPVQTRSKTASQNRASVDEAQASSDDQQGSPRSSTASQNRSCTDEVPTDSDYEQKSPQPSSITAAQTVAPNTQQSTEQEERAKLQDLQNLISGLPVGLATERLLSLAVEIEVPMPDWLLRTWTPGAPAPDTVQSLMTSVLGSRRLNHDGRPARSKHACRSCQHRRTKCVINRQGEPCKRCSSFGLHCDFIPSRRGRKQLGGPAESATEPHVADHTSQRLVTSADELVNDTTDTTDSGRQEWYDPSRGPGPEEIDQAFLPGDQLFPDVSSYF